MTTTPEPSDEVNVPAESDRFMSVAVHDIRNPIAVMRASAQMAQRQIDRGDLTAARGRLGVIVEQTDRVTRLMEMLLDAAYVEGGRMALRTEPIELSSLLEAAHAQIQSGGAPHSTRSLELDVEPDTVGAWDRARVSRAIEALLENAFIYGPLDQPVTVEARREGNSIILKFSGSGPGPTADEKPNLFKLFYRGSSAGEAGQPGSGLGLYTARGIARAHGGDVEFSPNGKPDIFKMVLPLGEGS